MSRRCAVIVVALIAAGCAVGPDYRCPDVDVPSAYYRGPSPAEAQSIADVGWWQVFAAPALSALIREALADNFDLRITAAQIAEAQAQVAAARSPIFPQVSGQLVASRGNSNTAFVDASSFVAALALSWEIDLWGRYRRATEAARAQLVATEEGRNGVIVSLVAGVAQQQYLALNGLHQRLAIVQQTARI